MGKDFEIALKISEPLKNGSIKIKYSGLSEKGMFCYQ